MARRVSSPVFVGRAQELGALQAALRRARDAEPGIVIVEGDAGIGKTRLVAEAGRRARQQDALVLTGAASATGLETAPFGPLVEAIRDRADAIDAELVSATSPTTRAALGRLVPTFGPAGADRAPAWADAMAQGSMLEGLLDLLGRLSERRPVLLVLEDLHWADRSTLAFLTFASRNLRSERLLIVGTVRTDDLAAFNEAEWSMLNRELASSRWAAAVDAWHQLGWPYDEASARLRHGEALLYERRPRAEATATLRQAHRIADDLGAVPLQRSIDELAHRAGLSLAANSGTTAAEDADQPKSLETQESAETPSGGAQPVGAPRLSKRELEVLRLVAEGRTNGEIGRELFVTTKTASSHVAHILDKLGASSRTEAAIIAERLGMLGD